MRTAAAVDEDEESQGMNCADFDSAYNIRPGDHLYQFYKSTDDYVASLGSFFRTGLLKGDACIWLADEAMGLEKIQKLLAGIIPDLLFHICTGQFSILSGQKWYLDANGQFNEDQALKNAEQWITRMLGKGYTCLRGAGDAAAIPFEQRHLLGEYEKKAHEIVHSAPVIAVCAYPILGCTLSQTRMVLSHHDHAMVAHF